MTFFQELFGNRVLLAAGASWFAAQLIKFFIYGVLYRKYRLERLLGSGGMPSSHTSLVVTLCIMTGFREGFASNMFAIAACLAGVVIYDAMGVRRETGRQGEIINRILKEMLMDGKPITEQNMKTLVGHSPLEVLGGIIVGVIIAFIFR